jgi:hypothetical protein
VGTERLVSISKQECRGEPGSLPPEHQLRPLPRSTGSPPSAARRRGLKSGCVPTTFGHRSLSCVPKLRAEAMRLRQRRFRMPALRSEKITM